MKLLLLSFFFFIWMPTSLMAQNNSTIDCLETRIIYSYKSLLVGKVTNDLIINYKNYLKFPNEFWSFLDKTFLDNWDFDATTQALIGRKIFHSLSKAEFKELSKALEVTLIRYAFESLSFYDEQEISVVDIKVNEQQTRAWLKIMMESPSFPDIHLDLLLKRRNDQWKGVDFRFKGITYVNLKKSSYQKDFEELKFKGLLRKLKNKNRAFFQDLCQFGANYIDPKKPPCLHIYDKK